MEEPKAQPRVRLVKKTDAKPGDMLPLCEAELKGAAQRWREHKGQPLSCGINARFVIDGRCYCMQHAQRLALEILMEV